MTAPPVSASPGRERLARLSARAGDLRERRTAGGSADRWLLIGGGLAMPLGVLLILLGWYGSAQTVLPFEQTPYLLSGGILGLALVIGGGFLYFAYWLTLLVREGRAERERLVAHHERVERLLVDLVGRVGAPSAAPGVARVVRTPSGTRLHRPECAATQGLQVVDVEVAPAGATVCGLCQPQLPVPTAASIDGPPQVRRTRAPRPARTAR